MATNLFTAICKLTSTSSQSLRAVFDKYASLLVDGQTYMTDEDFVIKYLVEIIILRYCTL